VEKNIKNNTQKLFLVTFTMFFIFIISSISIIFIITAKELGEGNILSGLYNVKPLGILIYIFKNQEKKYFLKQIIINKNIIFSLTGIGFLFITLPMLKNGGEKDMLNQMNVRNQGQQKNVAGYGEKGNARFMTEKEKIENIDNYIYKEDEPIRGVVLGMKKEKKLKRTKERIFVSSGDIQNLMIGATGSGKGRTILLQSIWNLGKTDNSIIVTDPKGELLAITKPYLEKKGYKVHLVDLENLNNSDRWDMLEYVKKEIDKKDYDKANLHAKTIAQLLCYEAKGGKDPIWYQSAVSLIQALILYICIEAEEEEKHMGSVLEMFQKYAPLNDNDESPLDKLMEKLPIKHLARKAYMTRGMSSGNTATSINTTTSANIQVLNSEMIEQIISSAEINFEKFADGKQALFIKIPSQTDAYNGIATILIEQSYQALIYSANNSGLRLKNKVYYILDELGNIPPIPELVTKITIARSYGISFTLVLQDLEQLEQKYKKAKNTIMSSCKNKLYIWTDDVKTNKEFSEMLGKYTRYGKTASINYSESGKASMSIRGETTAKKLKDPTELSKLPYGKAILFQASLFPAEMETPDLAFYEANKELGLAPYTGDVEHDQESNRVIIAKRLNEIKREKQHEEMILKYFDPIKAREKKKLQQKIELYKKMQAEQEKQKLKDSEKEVEVELEQIETGEVIETPEEIEEINKKSYWE